MRANLPLSIIAAMPTTEVLRSIVNQARLSIRKGEYGAALHLAVLRNDVLAARLLLEHGAAIDTPSSEGRNALMMSPSLEMTALLVDHGASLVHHFFPHGIDYLRWSPKAFTDLVSLYSQVKAGHEDSATFPPFLPSILDTRGGIDSSNFTISPDSLAAMMITGVKLTQELGLGMLLIHLAMVTRGASTLVLNSSLMLEVTTPFPWHVMFGMRPCFLTSSYRHFRRKLGLREFARIAHLQPDRGISPLCVAVAHCDTEFVLNCLELGAEVDFEGSPHGSALVVACACGHLEPVRALVRAGASLSYRGQTGHKSVFTFCRSHVIKRWLLVERFTEQRRIAMRQHWENGERIRPPAGAAVARLKLVGERAIRYHETLVDYAGRLSMIRKWWRRGRVVPPICIEGIEYIS